MKHPYRPDCDCVRCIKERARRIAQSANDAVADPHRRTMHSYFRRENSRMRKQSRRPAWGSQEWAETRGDDIDSPSGDY